MEKADKLIQKIDDELLKLYEASIHKGEYYHFNFKHALVNLNREFLKNGLYDKSNYINSNHRYEMIARNYREVFNDLSNSIAESIHYRYLSFDQKTGELEIEQITRNELNHTTNKKKYKKSYYSFSEPEEIDENEEDLQIALDSVDKHLRAEIIAANETAEKAKIEAINFEKDEADQAFKYFSNLKYPEDNYRELPWICKFDYLVRDCNVKYDRLGQVNYENEGDYMRFYFDNIDLFFKCIQKGVSFDSIFGHSFQIGYIPHFDVYRNKVSFEEYAKLLQDDRLLEFELQNDNVITIENDLLSNKDKEEKIESKREELIENTINDLNDKFISKPDLNKLKELFSINTISSKINWLGTYEDLVSSVNQWYDNKLIIFPSNSGTKIFIVNNFMIKGKDIVKGTLDNACTKQGYR